VHVDTGEFRALRDEVAGLAGEIRWLRRQVAAAEAARLVAGQPPPPPPPPRGRRGPRRPRPAWLRAADGTGGAP